MAQHSNNFPTGRTKRNVITGNELQSVFETVLTVCNAHRLLSVVYLFTDNDFHMIETFWIFTR